MGRKRGRVRGGDQILPTRRAEQKKVQGAGERGAAAPLCRSERVVRRRAIRAKTYSSTRPRAASERNPRAVFFYRFFFITSSRVESRVESHAYRASSSSSGTGKGIPSSSPLASTSAASRRISNWRHASTSSARSARRRDGSRRRRRRDVSFLFFCRPTRSSRPPLDALSRPASSRPRTRLASCPPWRPRRARPPRPPRAPRPAS